MKKYLIAFFLILFTCLSYSQTSEYTITLENAAGDSITTGSVEAIPYGNTYPTGAVSLTHLGNGVWQAVLSTGEWAFYYNGSLMSKYSRIFVGENKLKLIADTWDSTPQLKLSAFKDGVITYPKLTLTNGILNADINSSAGITYGKLNLTGGLVWDDFSLTLQLYLAGLVGSGSPGVNSPDGKAIVNSNIDTLLTIKDWVFPSYSTSEIDSIYTNTSGTVYWKPGSYSPGSGHTFDGSTFMEKGAILTDSVVFKGSFNGTLDQHFSTGVNFGSAKIRNVYTEWFGSGTSNDSTAFLHTVYAAQGKNILLLDKTYTADGIKMLSNTHIKGSDKYLTILKLNAGKDNFIYGDNIENVSIENLTVDGNKENQTLAGNVASQSNVRFDSSSHILMQNLRLRKAISFSVMGYDNSNFTMNRVDVDSCGNGTFNYKPIVQWFVNNDTSKNFTIENCDIDQGGMKSGGIAFTAVDINNVSATSSTKLVENIRFINNTIHIGDPGAGASASMAQLAIELFRRNGAVIRNVIIKGNIIDADSANSGQTYAFSVNASNMVISNNTVKRIKGQVCELVGDNISFVNNVIDSSGYFNVNDNYYVDRTLQWNHNITIANNTFFNPLNANYAIKINSNADRTWNITIYNNHIINPAGVVLNFTPTATTDFYNFNFNNNTIDSLKTHLVYIPSGARIYNSSFSNNIVTNDTAITNTFAFLISADSLKNVKINNNTIENAYSDISISTDSIYNVQIDRNTFLNTKNNIISINKANLLFIRNNTAISERYTGTRFLYTTGDIDTIGIYDNTLLGMGNSNVITGTPTYLPRSWGIDPWNVDSTFTTDGGHFKGGLLIDGLLKVSSGNFSGLSTDSTTVSAGQAFLKRDADGSWVIAIKSGF